MVDCVKLQWERHLFTKRFADRYFSDSRRLLDALGSVCTEALEGVCARALESVGKLSGVRPRERPYARSRESLQTLSRASAREALESVCAHTLESALVRALKKVYRRSRERLHETVSRSFREAVELMWVGSSG